MREIIIHAIDLTLLFVRIILNYVYSSLLRPIGQIRLILIGYPVQLH
jgi:hypothetical protein